jgi:hypothetical protein
MTPSFAGLLHSFSMINLVKLLPEWSWNGFDQVMAQACTDRVELVPSMLLGMDWDQQIDGQYGAVHQAMERLMERYTVSSIQSLTYGLQINLADQLINHPELLRRLMALGLLAKSVGCSVLVLGSPGQKKQLNPAMSRADHKQKFIANCSWMASMLGPELTLSLEHNTTVQGADYCNSLAEMVNAVKAIRDNGVRNVGLNLDTNCLIHEFGKNVCVGKLLASPELSDLITSIQVSYDFLSRNVPHRADDHRKLVAFARVRAITPSLEEFGLLENQVYDFVDSWKSLS